MSTHLDPSSRNSATGRRVAHRVPPGSNGDSWGGNTGPSADNDSAKARASVGPRVGRTEMQATHRQCRAHQGRWSSILRPSPSTRPAPRNVHSARHGGGPSVFERNAPSSRLDTAIDVQGVSMRCARATSCQLLLKAGRPLQICDEGLIMTWEHFTEI